jgi:hypothetical protein
MPGNRLDEALQQLEGDAPTPAPASPNPFDATVRELHAAGEQRLRRTFGEVADAAPDQAAQARRLGQQFGVPTAVVERNFAEYARKGQIEKPYRAIRKETPALAAWLEEPENAAVAKDDLEALGFLEWIVTAPTRAFEQGVNQIRLSQMRTREVNGATLTRAERDLLESYKYNMRAGGALGVGESWFRGAVTGGANLLAMVMGGAESAAKTAAAVGTGGAAAGALAGGLPGAVAGLGAGAAVGGVYGALQFGYDLEAGLAYDEFLDAGIEPHAARMAAMGAGAINALLETVQFKLLANTIPGVKRLRGAVTRGAIRQALKSPTVLAALTAAGREYAGTLAGESVTEAGQRAVTVLAGELAKITSEPGTDEVTRLGDADEQAFQTWAQQSGIKDLETAAYDYRGFFKANGPIPYQWGVDHLPDTFKQHGHPTFSVESTYSRGPMDGGRWAGETFITPKGRRVNMLDPVAAAAFEREQEGKPRTRRLTGPEIVAEVAQEFLGAVQAFALLPLPGAALQVQQGVQRAQQAQRNVQFFTTLGEGVAQSKTAQRMPEALESFLADATKDGPIRDVYVPLDSWVEYWQDKGVDPEQMAVEVTGSVEAFAHASATEDLVIPTARYAAKLAGTEHNAFFAQELRLKPHEMNGRESAVFLEQQARETARPPAAPEPTSPIREQLLADLTAAAVEPGTAATYADLHTSVVGNVADILGVDPVAYAARYGLTATREGLPPSAAPAARQAAARAAAQVTLSAVAAPLTDAETQALERREEAGAAPGGVERRAPTGALAADPTLLTRAAAQRRAVDTAAAAAQTRPDDTGAEAARAPAREGGRRPLSRIEESTPVARTTTYQTGPKAGQRRVVPETPVARTARRVAHYSKVFEAVAEAARALEPTVNLTALRREFDDRVELVESLDQEWRLEGHNPRVLLEAIAAAGGISVDYEERTGGQGLELRWVKDSPALGPFGSFGGVRGVFRVRAGASRGLASVGLSLDDMVRMLNQEERFAHIGDINDLVLELEWVSRLGEAPEGTSTFPGTEALRRRVGIDPRARWWLNEAFVETEFDQGLFDEAPPVKPTIKVRVGTRFEIDGKPLVVAPQGEKGSTVRGGVVWMVTPERAGQDPFAGEIWTFRVDELKRLYGSGRLIVTDALDTGEVQPRLPGAEEVREQEIATPELEAPFALTSEVSQRKGKQATLFQGAFHGSPHQFEKFSLHALGTGEGAQSFGWGLYFSSKREIAERYRQALAGPDRPKDLTFNGVGVFNGDAGLYRQEADPIIQRGLLEIVSRTYWVKPGPGWQAPMREMLERSVANVTAMHARGETLSGDQGRDRFDLENWRAAIVALDKYGDQLEVTAPSRAGRVYVVDIPEDADYLDYDRPASQQSRKVQDALTALGVRWDTFEPKSPAMFLRWFDGKDASRLWNEDVGIRESLREAHHYATQGDERALDAWQEKHQGFFPKGMVDPTGETIYGALAGQLYRSDLRPGGDIAAAYRRGPELASKALAAVGVAGIRYLDGFSRSDGQGTSNYVVFDDQLVKITEYDQAIQLAAVHQLSSENLAHADQLGGLAVPSIAVTPSTQGALQGYGEITLIGKRDLADPTKQPVFDADAYTSTFPQPEYGKAKQKVAQALVNKFRAVGVEFDDERLKDTIWDKAINTPNPRETVRAMQQSLAAQALFLREQGIAVEPVLAPATVEAAFVAMPAFQQFVQAHGGTISYGTSDTEYEQQLGAAIATAIEEYVLTAAPGNVALQDDLRGTYREAFLDEAGLPFFGRQIALSRSVAAVGRQDVQYGLTRERLEPLLRGRESAFLAWIEQQVLPMYPEPKLTLGRRKVDYTLANIVEKMLEGPTQANQSTLVFGEGKARAAAATRFTDLTWMRNAAEAIRPEGEITERRERAKALLTAWRDAVLESYTERDWRGHIDTWNGLDASMRALARWAKTRTGSAESRLASALAREGFRRVPSAVLAQGVAAGQAFLEAPVPYFESKPQRAVRLDEFAGAVIPENASDATRAILERHGIPFVTYPSDNPAARDVALTSFREDLQARRGALRRTARQHPRRRHRWLGAESHRHHAHGARRSLDVLTRDGAPVSADDGRRRRRAAGTGRDDADAAAAAAPRRSRHRLYLPGSDDAGRDRPRAARTLRRHVPRLPPHGPGAVGRVARGLRALPGLAHAVHCGAEAGGDSAVAGDHRGLRSVGGDGSRDCGGERTGHGRAALHRCAVRRHESARLRAVSRHDRGRLAGSARDPAGEALGRRATGADGGMGAPARRDSGGGRE